MKARLGAYALWQLRDFVFERAAAPVVIGALFVWSAHEQMGEGARRLIAEGGRHALEFGARAAAQHLSFVWFICALIAVHGISANDRTTGRFRLFFAKPVRVLPYYAQAYVLNGAAYMLCTVAAIAALSRIVPLSGMTLQSAIIILLVGYLLVGGVCFLASAVWRFDWVTTLAVWGIATWLAAKFRGAAWIEILPPFGRISEQIEMIRTMDPLETKPLLWVAAYGVACFLLGLIILKRRPLAT
jgi:hypothetical protein